MRLFVAALVVLGLVTFYFISWKLNKRQDLPDGMKGSDKNCEACGHTGCGMHPVQRGGTDE